MKSFSMAATAALSLSLGACGDSQTSGPANRANPAAESNAVHSASGTVTEVSGDRITISHGPVEGLGWTAMTMTFRAGEPAMVRGIGAGDRVAFEFREAGGQYIVTSINQAP